MSDYEGSGDLFEFLCVETLLPVVDVDIGVDDGPAHLGSSASEAATLELAAALAHEMPELLHLRDPLDREPHDLGIRLHTQSLLGTLEGAFIDEEGLSFEGGCRHLWLRAAKAYMMLSTGIQFK